MIRFDCKIHCYVPLYLHLPWLEGRVSRPHDACVASISSTAQRFDKKFTIRRISDIKRQGVDFLAQ